MKKIFFLITGFVFLTCNYFAQEILIIPDLKKVTQNDGWKIYNRNVSVTNDAEGTTVHFNSQAGDGIVWLDGFDFSNGTIEVDIKGKNVTQGSFVGITLRGLNDTTYDAIYFRPFNFMSNDSVKKSHSVQYVSQPTNTWQKLRSETPGKYENTVVPMPDPNSFFHTKIVVEKPKVRVFVNGSSEPCLVVDELSGRSGGWVGLWVGNYSDGDFKNLKISKVE
jgi:hypothetical protein